MPVYPLRFTRWEGERRSTSWSWFHLAHASIRRLKWNRAMKFVRNLWFAYTVFFFVLVYLSQRATIFGISLETFANTEFGTYIKHAPTRLFMYLVSPLEVMLLVIFSLFAGAGLLADDRRTGAIGLYLSKPVTRFQYLASRIAVLAGYIGFFSILPALGMVLFEILIANDTIAALSNLWLVPALLFLWAIYTILFGLPILVLSSITDRGRTAGVLFVLFWFIGDLVGGVLDLMTRIDLGSLIDLNRMAMGSASAILGPKGANLFDDMLKLASTPVLFAALLVYAAAGLGILWVRSRPVGGNR